MLHPILYKVFVNFQSEAEAGESVGELLDGAAKEELFVGSNGGAVFGEPEVELVAKAMLHAASGLRADDFIVPSVSKVFFDGAADILISFDDAGAQIFICVDDDIKIVVE